MLFFLQSDFAIVTNVFELKYDNVYFLIPFFTTSVTIEHSSLLFFFQRL